MKYYKTENIRNVVLMGQGHSGKTALSEAMLFYSKTIERLGKIADGTTASDYDPEEIKRKISISASLIPLEWNDCKINIIDTPGYFDFEGEVIEGMRGADAALIVVSGKSGIGVGTNKAVALTKAKKLPKAFFVSKLDAEHADFFKVYESLRQEYGMNVCAVEIPIIENEKFIGVFNIIDMKARGISDEGNRVELPVTPQMEAAAKEYRDNLNEMIAQTCEELMNKYFAGEPFDAEDTKKGMAIGILAGDIIPVMCGSSVKITGIGATMDMITGFFPVPGSALIEKGTGSAGEKREINVTESEPLCALAFKTVADPFVGKMTYLKVISGTLNKDSTVVNARTGQNEKIGRVYFVRGKTQVDTDRVAAGDICVVTKLDKTLTGDTLCAPSRVVSVYPLDFPKPCISMAIIPQSKGDEEKISIGMQRLSEEDVTFTFVNNIETKQHIISGLGEMHLDVLISKLATKFGTVVTLEEPKTAYRETIRNRIKVEGKHKKQSGGHGQYGHVWIEFEPTDSSELVFEEKIFGGSVPRNFFPAVEKGLRDSVEKGVLAGYPVVNIKATLLDGSYHPVDSSEMAFKIAASMAFKEGMEKASPVLLEPIGILNVVVEEQHMGDVMGDINKKRGKVLGMSPSDSHPGYQEVTAEVPMAELNKYAVDLRSMTRGSGSFTLSFDHYGEVPSSVSQKIIENHKSA